MNEKRSDERRFVVDSMLGKVAKWLRVLGFDVQYGRIADRRLLDGYLGEGRFVITRNRRWCGQPQVLCLTSNDPREQLREVVAVMSITPHDIRPFQRCIVCNEPLQSLPRSEAFACVPDFVFETNVSFFQCPRCSRVYWPGSHPRRIKEQLQDLLGWAI